MRLIDANKLVMHLADFALSMSGKPGYSEIQQCMEAVEEQPTADPVKHGRWEFFNRIENCFDITGVPTWANQYKCKNCGLVHTVIEDFGIYSYCPHCGAYMLDEARATLRGNRSEDE